MSRGKIKVNDSQLRGEYQIRAREGVITLKRLRWKGEEITMIENPYANHFTWGNG